MKIAHAGHAELLVNNLEASKKFFTETMGLFITEEDATSVYLRAWQDWEHHTLMPWCISDGASRLRRAWNSMHAILLKPGLPTGGLKQGQSVGRGERCAFPRRVAFPWNSTGR